MSEREADALVIFGITGDLARKQTFRSLYRLERRGLLDVPVLGVARQNLTDDDLRGRARDAIGLAPESSLHDRQEAHACRSVEWREIFLCRVS